MIWFKKIELIDLNLRSKNTIAEFLGIEFKEISDCDLTAVMEVKDLHKQPIGIMHGGVSCLLAETVGSTAANFCVDPNKYYCVGLDINTNHIKSVKCGYVKCIGEPLHIGNQTQVWSMKIIEANSNKIISVSRLTMLNICKNP